MECLKKHLRELNGWCRDDGRYSCRTIMSKAQHGGCLRAGTHLSLCAVQGDVDYVWQTYMDASVCCRRARAGAQLLSRHPSTIKSQSLNSTAFTLTDNTVYCFICLLSVHVTVDRWGEKAPIGLLLAAVAPQSLTLAPCLLLFGYFLNYWLPLTYI